MQEILIAYAIAIPVFLAIYIPHILSRKRKEEAGCVVGEDIATRVNEAEAMRLVRDAHRSLVRQGAPSFGPWLASIIGRAGPYEVVRDHHGFARVVQPGGCPPKVALTALKMTRRELDKGRFDLSVINRAISTLERM